MTFQVKTITLPHAGIIPGARGHKKITIPRGTVVFAVTYEGRYYAYLYLNEASAQRTLGQLEELTAPTSSARRHMTLETLIAWNFGRAIPYRVVREKERV